MRFFLISLIALATGSGAAPTPTVSAEPAERTPNFVSVCRHSHSAPDDPIVYPNQPGAAHEHDFLANTSTDAFSTYESLRASGTTSLRASGTTSLRASGTTSLRASGTTSLRASGTTSLRASGTTTCQREDDTAAYWVPSLTDDGETVRPRLVRAYYLTAGKDPASIQAPPADLRVIAGPDERATRWACVGPRFVGRSTRTVPTCAQGTFLVMRVTFPDCWNGRDADSADHRSHMAYSRRGSCPSAHPVPVPQLFLGVRYPGSDGGAISLSSGGPETAHADFLNGWDQAELERLVRECLNAGVRCGER